MFKVGDRVKWESGAGRGWARKEGKIIAVVPANIFLQEESYQGINSIPSVFVDKKTHRLMFDFPATARPHASYIVEVPGKTDTAKPRLYWPRVSQLERA